MDSLAIYRDVQLHPGIEQACYAQGKDRRGAGRILDPDVVLLPGALMPST